jgi:glycosyltransferase involved in cell wall biosynthesis
MPLADRLGGEADREYFEARVKPLLRHPLIEYVGELADSEKEAFFQNAIALLFPIDWPEPFGLVQIEALACGTPILARPLGSVPEIVEPGVTGYLCDTTAQFVEGIRSIDDLDRHACRASFEERFTTPVMAAAYERVFEAVVARAPALAAAEIADEAVAADADPLSVV